MDSCKLDKDMRSVLTLLIVVVAYKNSLLILIFPPREVIKSRSLKAQLGSTQSGPVLMTL
jgi:hypothetical protein